LITTGVRLNIGAGEFALKGFTNIDSEAYEGVDLLAIVPPIPYPDNSADELWACHFLEHLDQPTGAEFLRECFRVLRPGGQLGVVVPDTWIIMREYVKRSAIGVEWPYGVLRAVADLDEVCGLFLYSTLQPSPHRWSYDERTLSRALERAGFEVVAQIDRFNDPRLGSGQWYQVGLSSIKPGDSS
jgi:predicted SAM-dependent methyltransferase